MGLIASVLPVTFGSKRASALGCCFRPRAVGAAGAKSSSSVFPAMRRAPSAKRRSSTPGRGTCTRSWSIGSAAGGASAVAFDLMFHERRPGPGDELFAAAIERAGNVVLLEETRERGGAARRQRRRRGVETRTPPLPELKAAALGSAPFVLPTVPVSVGQFWTFGRATRRQAVATRRLLCKRTCCRITRIRALARASAARRDGASGRRRAPPCRSSATSSSR